MFVFKAKIFEIGKSNAIIIPKPVMDNFHLKKGMTVELKISDDGIMISVPAEQPAIQSKEKIT